MIRVLHILHSMNRGGTEAMLMNYFRNIDRSQVQFDFLLTESRKCQYEDEIEELGGKVYRVPRLSLRNPFPYISGVRRFLNEHKEYSIVHSHTSSKSAVPLWIAKRCGVPVRICHSHNSKSEKGINGHIRELLKKPLKKVATDFLACSNEAAKWLYGERMLLEERVKIINNAIDIQHYIYNDLVAQDIRVELGLDDAVFVLGMVARFSKQKNHIWTLNIVKRLQEEGIKVKLLLVGDGELRSEIEETMDELGIGNNVVMVGVVPDVHTYLQAMDVLLMPSLHEGLGIAVIEAQTNGLPCIVSMGVPKEADVTGNVTFLPLNVNEWSESLLSMIKEKIGRDSCAVNKVRDAGYDITIEGKKLERWYLDKYKRINNEVI